MLDAGKPRHDVPSMYGTLAGLARTITQQYMCSGESGPYRAVQNVRFHDSLCRVMHAGACATEREKVRDACAVPCRRAATLKPDSKLAQLAADTAASVRAMACARMARVTAPAAVPGASLWTTPDQAAQDNLAAGWPPACRRQRSRRASASASEQSAGRAHGQPFVRGAPIGVEQAPTQAPQAAEREPDAAGHTSSVAVAG